MNTFTPLDSLVLEKKFDELEKKAQLTDIEKHLAIDNTVLLHPAIDFVGNVGVLGFRTKKKNEENKLFEQNIFILIKNGKLSLEHAKLFNHEDKTYFIDDKDKLLPLLNDKWTTSGIKAFVTEPTFPPFETVFDTIKKTTQKYFFLSEDADYDLITAWIIGTYFHRLFFSYPFLHLKAPKGSGKSQLLGVLEKLCFNAVKARPTVASMGDIVTSLRCTFLIDQADSLHNDNNYEIREILTDSYKVDGGRRRVLDMKRGRKQLEFETFSPKAFASTIELPEDLRDRCMLIPIVRSSHMFPTPDDQNEDWYLLRESMYKFLLHFPIIREMSMSIKKTYTNDKHLYGRTLDLWLPIETMMTFFRINNDRIQSVKKLYLHRNALMQYEPKEHEEEVVGLLMKKFEDKDRIEVSVKELTSELNNQRRSLMEQTFNFEVEDLNEKKVGWVITNFNLSSDKKRRNKGIVYIFDKSKLEVIYKQYFNTYEETTQLHSTEE